MFIFISHNKKSAYSVGKPGYIESGPKYKKTFIYIMPTVIDNS